jgi:hypothetical protein
MKLRSKLGPIVAAVVLLGTSQIALAQVDWTFQGPAVGPGDPGNWDSYGHRLGDVVFDGTTYHMFLTGAQTFLPWDSPTSVGHWTWNALTQEWDADPKNPVLVPEPGEWDGFSIYSVAVLYDGDVFKMWYGAVSEYPGPSSVGYATSADGSVWFKHPGNPLPGLEPGVPGAWDDCGMDASTVLFDGDEYRMWYFAIKCDGSSGLWRLGTATSPDGLAWTKHADPVLEGRQAWEGNVYLPEVIAMGGGYAMWYSGVAAGVARIGYAVSPDGLHWGKWPGNPVLTPLPGCNALDSVAVIVAGDTVHGWASNCDTIYYATSQLEVVFFDHFETGDTTIWSAVGP